MEDLEGEALSVLGWEVMEMDDGHAHSGGGRKGGTGPRCLSASLLPMRLFSHATCLSNTLLLSS